MVKTLNRVFFASLKHSEATAELKMKGKNKGEEKKTRRKQAGWFTRRWNGQYCVLLPYRRRFRPFHPAVGIDVYVLI